LQRIAQIKKVLYITLFLNLSVSFGKIIYGYITDSVGILSDGYHSLFDGISNIIGIVGISLSSQPPDKTHHYGHRKVETLFTIFIGILMFVACYEIFKNVYEAIFKGHRPELNFLSLIIMLLTLCVNIFVVIYEKKMSVRLKSEFLSADSKHTLSDVFVTIGVIIGIVLQMVGFKFADVITGSVVGFIVAYTGFQIIRESADVLVDKSTADVFLIKDIVCQHKGVIECHNIRTRGVKTCFFVDLHILVRAELTVRDAHRIAHEVEDELKTKIPEIVDVVVHIEPKEVR